MHTTDVILVAAGTGTRAADDGTGLPKQYQPVAGRPLLAWTLSRFLSHTALRRIQPVIHPDHHDAFTSVVVDLPVGSVSILPSVMGGTTRQASVLAGLDALSNDPPDAVLIHDAARPFVSAALIDAVTGALTRGAAGVIPVAPLPDTLRTLSEDGALGPVADRRRYGAVQTPQGFRFPDILAAHRAMAQRIDLTDDAQVLEAAGGEVVAVAGQPDNLKITYAEDITRADAILRRDMKADTSMPATIWETRTGQGFDVHAFGPGDHVMLCGVKIPFDRGLVGHSDADVGLHTITDALFGALADGDIGTHFPPSDPRWKGASSDQFLTFARDRVTARNGRIVHVDVTVICEAPKIGPWRNQMTTTLAPLLGISSDRISIKATTTERLGFTGRAEGIAALATATIQLPLSPISET
ncbi:MAG: bifunctional 2-C-methyl-D-erythritol 4-phosphate cytidylyltransferase/2-C-methyl-D-erythritol 2,4-cyclodiphosphate synthase [Pseudomonadota bacterium]